MVVVVASGGLPVTEVTNGLGLVIPDNGQGVAVTRVAQGGMAVILVKPAAPVLNSINPVTAPAGVNTTLHVLGTGFNGKSVITLNGVDQPTTFNSPTDLSTVLNLAAGSYTVRVRTGGATSTAGVRLTVS